jgi:hypothetical protein
MAKVISPFKLKGAIGDIVFYENEYGPQARQKGSPTEWHIKHQDSFKNALRTGAEWKRATAAAKLLRCAAGGLLKSVTGMGTNGHFNKALLSAIKADKIHGLGERVIGSGNPGLLTGLELSYKLSLDDALPLNPEHCYTMEGGKISLQVPAFRLRKKKALPGTATHYRLVSAVLRIDFEKNDYDRDIKAGPLQAMGRKAGEAFSVEHVLAEDTVDRFWLLGIEFYKVENGKQTLVKGGGALRVMQWVKPVKELVVPVEVVKKAEVVAQGLTVEKEGPVGVPLATTASTLIAVVQYGYVGSGQQRGNVVYQVGQQGWYGTSSGLR